MDPRRRCQSNLILIPHDADVAAVDVDVPWVQRVCQVHQDKRAGAGYWQSGIEGPTSLPLQAEAATSGRANISEVTERVHAARARVSSSDAVAAVLAIQNSAAIICTQTCPRVLVLSS